jgi:Hint domain-containing protein
MTVTAGSPSMTPGSTIINNSDTPDGTIFQFSGGTPVTVTLDDTSANTDVLEDDDHTHHTIVDGSGLVATGMGVEAESLIYVRAIDGAGNPTGPTITIAVFSQDGVTQDIWGFHSDIALVAGQEYVKTGGNSIGSAPYSSLATQPVCYAKGTLIDTPNGPTPVESLKPGDLVWTLDHGSKPVRWIRIEAQPLDAVGADAKPVLIAAGALGAKLPARDLIVSPQHRILVGGHRQLQQWFKTEAFVPAKSLTRLQGIRHMRGKTNITWIHFAFDRHEIVTANGCLAESLLFGPMVVNGLTAAELRAVTDIYGPARTPGAALNGPPARECLGAGPVRRHLAKSSTIKAKRVAKEIGKWDADSAIETCRVKLARKTTALNQVRNTSAA